MRDQLVRSLAVAKSGRGDMCRPLVASCPHAAESLLLSLWPSSLPTGLRARHHRPTSGHLKHSNLLARQPSTRFRSAAPSHHQPPPAASKPATCLLLMVRRHGLAVRFLGRSSLMPQCPCCDHDFQSTLPCLPTCHAATTHHPPCRYVNAADSILAPMPLSSCSVARATSNRRKVLRWLTAMVSANRRGLAIVARGALAGSRLRAA